MNKEECLEALEKIKNDQYFIAEDDEGDLIHIVNLYKNELKTLRCLIEEHFDENGNVKAFATIHVDEDKLIEICKEAAENVKEKFVDRYEKMLDKACEFLAESHVKESGWSNKDKWKEWLEKQVKE